MYCYSENNSIIQKFRSLQSLPDRDPDSPNTCIYNNPQYDSVSFSLQTVNFYVIDTGSGDITVILLKFKYIGQDPKGLVL